MSYRIPIFCAWIVLRVTSLFAEENFLLINGSTNEVLLEMGPHVEERITPCSSFKIALSLMGYDAGILKDEQNPVWHFQEGYDDYLERWKDPQSPQSWMQYSCVWYSKVLALQLSAETMQHYLSLLEYGNQDLSGGLPNPGPLNPAWIASSLKISPKEQVDFIRRMIFGRLPISKSASSMTKALLFKEELPEGGKLFGKTGYSGSIRGQDGETLEMRWFVGWVEQEDNLLIFAYNIRSPKIDLSQTIPRVKQLLSQAAQRSDL